MGLRAFFILNTAEDMGQQGLAGAIRDISAMPGIDSVDPVSGSPDMVVMVDAPITVQALANKVMAKPWVKNLQILRIMSIFERHKTIKASKLPIFELAGVGISDSETAPVHQSVSIFELLGIAGVITKSRAYFLINAADNMDQREFIKAVRDIEETPGVDYVDPVLGPPDMVVMVDASAGVDVLAAEIKAKPWVKDMQVLPLASVFEQHVSMPARVPVSEPVESLSIYELLGVKVR